MVEVVIDSIRISLISQHRIVMLRDVDGERQLAIWIGPCEAESITLELQDTEIARPMTHDLLKNVIETMNGKISHILINSLQDQVFYARLYIDIGGKLTDVDCRPSDAIAIAVRAKVPVFIEEDVMEAVGILPEPDLTDEDRQEISDQFEVEAEGKITEEKPAKDLDAFTDFLDTLDFDDFDEE
ncbi:MAG: bifunctional DNase/RNase [Cellvibrionaceae bacterium]|jgi:bifunctional DNase/RNase